MIMRRALPLASCCLVLSLYASGWCQEAYTAAARLVEGSSFAGKLSRIEPGRAIFSVDGKQRSIPLDDLFAWGQPAEVRKGSYVLLADGGLIAGEITSLTPDHVQVSSSRRPGMWKSSQLPRKAVKAIVYQSSASLPERDRFDYELLSARDAQDRVLLVSGDTLSGALLDAQTPEAAEGGASALRFLLPAAKEPLAILQDRILAAVLNEGATPSATTGFWLGMADGSQLLASSVEQADDSLTVTLANGATLQAATVDNDLEPPESFWSRVTLLQPLSPRVAYLSDLKTIGFKHVPLLDWQQDYANDRSVTQSRLRSEGVRFIKGIGMPATSRLAYEVPEGAKRFESDVSLDDDAGPAGSVIFRVFLEAAGGSWKPAFESKVFRGGDPAQSVRVELGEARRLALVVDMADQGDQRDYADWLNARFVK
jgi:hypothetical protein